ncbi:hypothetical protein CWB96_16260 [Pseudoalteromonas citrea]|uniref:Uncharacterized protein n=2 Tax=Pseudoalteromonas citrea TaxID=43655 RepID=A0A5S3XKX6_9GAMM|nr:hypothetical protein CWB97_06305 [Pseudoalteromonas citrea]TMP55819.1 hypothetical protein CWB96_16260 [Pseudoalteromonas citrea]
MDNQSMFRQSSVLLCLGLMMANLYFLAPVQGKQSFQAGVIAQELHLNHQVTQLGVFSSCKVVNAIKQDLERSACMLYSKSDNTWQLDSFGAICEVHCTNLSHNKKAEPLVIFNRISTAK